MPGIIYHLAFAEKVYQHLEEKVDKVQFFSGNLIPDLALDKKSSHYSIPASMERFFIPDMNIVKRELYDKKNSIKLGMFCHLYLDCYFIENFLIPEFVWDIKNLQVINPRNNNVWSISQFFAAPSKGGILYNGYTQINKMMLADGHINMQTINMLPDILPITGLPVFDERREKTWREELDSYLAEDSTYTGEYLDYERLWSSISSIADKFVREEI